VDRDQHAPHREHVAIENLTRQKFVVYCPMELKRIRHARRTQDVVRPLFPGYIFAEVLPDLTLCARSSPLFACAP
jgi:transcriptional antiterminator RfaH